MTTNPTETDESAQALRLFVEHTSKIINAMQQMAEALGGPDPFEGRMTLAEKVAPDGENEQFYCGVLNTLANLMGTLDLPSDHPKSLDILFAIKRSGELYLVEYEKGVAAKAEAEAAPVVEKPARASKKKVATG